ncbi:MAG: alpha-galactosidase [Firmicutes bacterium]|nr:alpha-galactosidase [Bacillota bacterium]
MPKIAIIGAGSVIFAKQLISDILSQPALTRCTLSLMDIDPNKLALTGAVARRLIKDNGLGAKVEETTDRRAALNGADYVLCLVQIGGIDIVEKDITIPSKYGINQAVGDTLGPAGIVRAQRSIPVILDIARDMEELCPDAWLLNYTNPMVMITKALYMETKIKALGLCHAVQGTVERLAALLEMPIEELTHWVAGINHMAWVLRLEDPAGNDLYPRLFAALEDPTLYGQDKIGFEMLKYFGYFVTESSHVSEYVPYLRQRPELVEYFGVPEGRVLINTRKRMAKEPAKIKDMLESPGKLSLDLSGEYASRIMNSLETGEMLRINANVQNTNLITNLPQGSCVEVPCLVDKAGVHPCHVGALPSQLAALCNSNVSVQDLAVEAILEENLEKLIQAIALDPLTAATCTLPEIWEMSIELLQSQREMLPPGILAQLDRL